MKAKNLYVQEGRGAKAPRIQIPLIANFHCIVLTINHESTIVQEILHILKIISF